MQDLADELGVSESRISQLRAEALLLLKELRLQQPAFIVAVLYVGIWFAVVGLRKLNPDFQAPLLFVSPTLINVQVPMNVPAGTATVAVSFNNSTASTTLAIVPALNDVLMPPAAFVRMTAGTPRRPMTRTPNATIAGGCPS